MKSAIHLGKVSAQPHHYASIHGALLFSVLPIRFACITKYGAVQKFFLHLIYTKWGHACGSPAQHILTLKAEWILLSHTDCQLFFIETLTLPCPVSKNCTVLEYKMSTLPTLDSQKTTYISDQDNCGEEDISVVTYNILADFYVQSALKKGRYKNCPEEYVTPNKTGAVHDTSYLWERYGKSSDIFLQAVWEAWEAVYQMHYASILSTKYEGCNSKISDNF